MTHKTVGFGKVPESHALFGGRGSVAKILMDESGG
jgi:hypothetical protein